MAYDGRVMRLALERFDEDRRARSEEQERRRERVFARQPRLREIEGELRSTMSRIIAQALRQGTDPIPAVERLRNENLRLQEEKRTLLRQMGLPEDYLEEQPVCPICNDTGYDAGGVCRCLRAYYAKEQQKELSRMLDLGNQSFDTFELEWYSDQVDPAKGISPQENMKWVYDVCAEYAHWFGRKPGNLLLFGAPGLGKTFLSACIARTVSESGFSVVYDTAVNIFTRFEEQKFARDRLEAGEAKDETRRYLGCDLLILDDLGSELSTPFVQSALYTLINTRLTADKRTVISSNLTMDQVRARYTPQIASRLEGEYRVLPFYGEDIRLLRKQTL